VAISPSVRSAPPDQRESLALVCALAREPAELDGHFAIRRAMFVDAQRIFEHDDRDARDDHPATRHAVALAGDEVVGAVRFYPLDGDGLWKGDRLAVLPARRASQLGAMLVRFAVRTAGELGGRRMVAQIQVPNVRFFERLGWCFDGDAAPMFGVTHQPMTIDLSPDSVRSELRRYRVR
jgi:putative N-acetyltransferase (TIGR04045 family)